MSIGCAMRLTDRSDAQFTDNVNTKYYKKGNKGHIDAVCYFCQKEPKTNVGTAEVRLRLFIYTYFAGWISRIIA